MRDDRSRTTAHGMVPLDADGGCEGIEPVSPTHGAEPHERESARTAERNTANGHEHGTGRIAGSHNPDDVGPQQDHSRRRRRNHSRPRPGPSKRHEQVVRSLLDAHPGAQTRGFRAALLVAFDGNDDLTEVAEELPRLVPDVFLVDCEARRIDVWEVSLTNPPSDEKLETYGMLWFYMDCGFWELRGWRVNRVGFCEPLNLMTAYYSSLIEQALERDAA